MLPALTEPGPTRGRSSPGAGELGCCRLAARLRKPRNQPSSSSDPEARIAATALLPKRRRSCLHPAERSASTRLESDCRSLAKRNCRRVGCSEWWISSDPAARLITTALLPKRQSLGLHTGERSASRRLEGDCPSLAKRNLLTHRPLGVVEFVPSISADGDRRRTRNPWRRSSRPSQRARASRL